MFRNGFTPVPRKAPVPNALNDIQTLVAGLGGTAAVPGIYDLRYNVARSGSNMTTWDDAYASGRAPQWTVASGSPQYDASLGIRCDGSTSSMTTATNAIFDPSPGMTIVLIGSVPSNSTGFCALGVSSGSNWFTIRGNGGTYGLYDAPGSSTGLTSPTTLSSTCRMVTASVGPPNQFGGFTPGGSSVVFDVFGNYGPNLQYFYPASSWSAKTFNARLGTGVSGLAAVNARAIIFLSSPMTTTQRATIVAWAKAQHSIVEDTSKTYAAFFPGDSLTYGVAGGSQPPDVNGTGDYPLQVSASGGGFTSCAYANMGVPSMTGQILMAAMPYWMIGMIGTSNTKKAVGLWAIHNDLIGLGPGGDQAGSVVAANTATMVGMLQSYGATHIVLLTQPPSSQINSAGVEAQRIACNSAIRLLATSTVAVADAASNTLLNPLTGIYRGDTTHFSLLGYGEIATNATTGVAAAFASIGFT